MKQYLGLDSSTQGLKAVILGEQGVIAEENIRFGDDLPGYHSPNGFLNNEENPQLVHADPIMWLDALDMLLEKMQKRGIRLDQISGISGSGQQHGSVYLKSSFHDILSTLNPKKSLAEQIRPALARPTAPIWMDHSTGEQCKALSARFGKSLQQITGSAATERFTGPQIMKFAQQEPERWQDTAYVHLVSSFLCSVLCGKNASVDYGDGAGMNLLNLNTLQWDHDITDFTAPELAGKLPSVVPSNIIAGGLCAYFEKYGLKRNTPVVVWSGDNPCSMVGIGCTDAGTIGISLGTSDTLFAPISEFKTDPAGCGHIFGNRTGGFLSLICFANGSLAREKLRSQYGFSREKWETAICQSVSASGKIKLPYFEPECTPPIAKPCVCCNFGEAGHTAETIRALLETQILSMKYHGSWMGLTPRRIRLTGGASRSAGLSQIIADIFQADVELLENTNAAAVGAAMCAANAIEKIPFRQLSEQFCSPVKTVHPNPRYASLYEKQMAVWLEFMKKQKII